jgi:aldose 1-epimerase
MERSGGGAGGGERGGDGGADPAAVRHVLGRAGGLRLEVLAYGAAVHRLEVPTAHGPRNVVLGHRTPAGYATGSDFHGATIGRYANRVAGGRFRSGGSTYRLEVNENGNTLHGGPGGFHTRTWTTEKVGDRSVTMSLVSPDGDQGFPGELRAQVTYTVHGDEVAVDLSATTSATTVVNLTNHSYFNLDGEGAGSVDDHELRVAADSYTPVDDRLLPTGEVAPVDGTPLDLRRPTRLGDAVRTEHPQLAASRGIDHNLVPGGSGMREVARVATSDLAMSLWTDAPGLQVYTGNFLDGSAVGTGGRVYRQGDGLALEPQAFPDSPNHPEFPSVRLDPGEVYRRSIRWRFSSPDRP